MSSICWVHAITATHRGSSLSMRICTMAALAFLTAAAVLLASPTLSAAVSDRLVVDVGCNRFSATISAERIEAAVTASVIELSVNLLMHLAGGGLAGRVSGFLFLLPHATAVPGAAEGSGRRAAVQQEPLASILPQNDIK